MTNWIKIIDWNAHKARGNLATNRSGTGSRDSRAVRNGHAPDPLAVRNGHAPELRAVPNGHYARDTRGLRDQPASRNGPHVRNGDGGARGVSGVLGVRDRVFGRVRIGRRGVSGVAARWRAVRGAAADAGMSTAEYAVGTVAACAFAAVLYKVVTSSAVSSALSGMIKKALGVAF